MIHKNILGEEGKTKKEKYFSQANTIEYAGSISTSFNYRDPNEIICCAGYSIHLNIDPTIAYYLINALHIDMSLGFYFSYRGGMASENNRRIISWRNRVSLNISPSIGAGYTFMIVDNLFFDINGSIGGGIPIINEHASKYYSVFIRIGFNFKFALGNGLINSGMDYSIRYAIPEGPSRDSLSNDLYLRLGYSIYFHLD